MTPQRLRAALQFGVLALLLLAPLPYGSVQPGPVLGIELTATVLGLGTILLIGRDESAWTALPKAPLAVCAGVIALGIFQIIPFPFSLAEKFNPTAELVRPLIPFLGLDHPPAVSWSVATPETSNALLRFIAYVLIGLTVAVSFDTERARRRFAIALVSTAVFQAVYGSGEYLTGRQHIFGFAKKHYLDSATGTFINRNHFATLLAIALPFALTLAIRDRDDRPWRGWRDRIVTLADGPALTRLLAIVASALVWMGLLLSHSRAGLAASLAGAGIVLFHFRGSRAARWTAVIGTCVLGTLLTLELAQAPGERFFEVKDDVAAKGGRLTVWRDSINLVTARPVLGWGFGSFEAAFPLVQTEGIVQHYDHAHNDWLEWTTDGGILTLLGALTLLALAVRSGDTASRAALVALALHAIWDFSLRIPAVAVVTAATIGVGYAAAEAKARAQAKIGAISWSELR